MIYGPLFYCFDLVWIPNVAISHRSQPCQILLTTHGNVTFLPRHRSACRITPWFAFSAPCLHIVGAVVASVL